MSASVQVSGPLFDGRADKAAQEACDEAERSVSIIGASMVRTALAGTLKVQRPYYRTRVEAQPDPPGWKITDQGVIYGPWLEGIGSRNFPKTRFKGYATFRRTTQAIQARANDIANGVVARFMGRMN